MGHSQREIAMKLGVKSKSTISRWMQLDFDEQSIEERQKYRSRSLLTKDQEVISSGWVVYSCCLRKSTTTSSLMKFIESNWEIEAKKSWIR